MSEAPDPVPVPARLGERRLFPTLDAWSYLSHAAISPPSTAVQAASLKAFRDFATRGVAAFPAWAAQRRRLKEKLGQLIGAAGSDIALLPNTTSGIVAIARCFPWQTGDGVLCFTGEFPTNVTPWQQAARSWQLDLRFARLDPLAEHDFAALDRHLAQGVKLVAISAVQFQTGLRLPIEAIADRVHAAGAQIFVDGIQACGVCPLEAGGVDYMAVGSHKWLMGPEGAGFLYVHPDRVARLEPRLAGWLSHTTPVDFLFEPDCLRYDKPVRQTADAFEGGSANTIGYAGLEAAVDAILNIGRHRIFSHVQIYLDQLEAGLIERGFTSLRRAQTAARSGILGVYPPDGITTAAMAGALNKRGVSVTTPDGVLRFAPHWPNALKEVPRVLDTLDEALREARGEKAPTLAERAEALADG
jgi:selenocysteine lyase/cysteine desulfurase